MATAITAGAKRVVSEPLLTGALLYALTRGPIQLRERLLSPFQTNLLAHNGPAKIETLVKVLRVLVGWGVVRRLNQALNAFAWNNYTLGRHGSAFRFGPAKEELVVITGGSSGFGYEMVKGFAKNARVVVFDVQDFPQELASLDGVFFYRCDVTDTKAVEDLCVEVKRTHGDPTVLINNAGIANGKTVLDTTNAECEKLFKVNLIAHFVLIRQFLPGMLRKHRGHIVTIASMASFVAAPGLLDYCCSKVGALFVSEGIRAECLSRYEGGKGICTTSVHPSWHRTGILKGAEQFLEKYGIKPDPPSNVSNLVVEQVLQGKSGRLCVPTSEDGKTGMRNWPRWAQDLMYGLILQRRDSFGFEKKE